ncbi:MAG: RusA family crossover junction endodeoxyribonuclease [Nitrospira sp.]|nr:RusA family crossover junction endodeoxyribonuclease [Nitrospira sp.]
MSRHRQSSIPIRTTSFRPPAQKAPFSAQEPVLPRTAIRTRPPATAITSAPLSVRVTADSIALTLPVPPSVNHQYATANGRRLLSAKGRAFKELVGQQILVALAQSPHRGTLRRTLSQASLSLSIQFFFASALRRDTDGGLKIAQDALCEGLGLNDNRVVETHLYKHQDRDNPRMEILVSVSPLAAPDSACPTQLEAALVANPDHRSGNRRDR